MAKISAAMVKELREKTGAGMMDCKEALSECGGDLDRSIDFLRKKGLATAAKRSGREMAEGTVNSYIHMGGKIGVLVEIVCETDFVAKNKDFIDFSKNIAMHIAATDPIGISPEDVPAETVNREKQIYRAQALEMGKPENMADRIVEGKLKKFFKESCLLSQTYIRDSSLTIDDLLNELIGKMGENIRIKKIARFCIGE